MLLAPFARFATFASTLASAFAQVLIARKEVGIVCCYSIHIAQTVIVISLLFLQQGSCQAYSASSRQTSLTCHCLQHPAFYFHSQHLQNHSPFRALDVWPSTSVT